jgi:hypothetical protein
VEAGGVGETKEIGGSPMTDEARQEGISRSEFYGVVGLLFLSLFAVVNLLALSPAVG